MINNYEYIECDFETTDSDDETTDSDDDSIDSEDDSIEIEDDSIESDDDSIESDDDSIESDDDYIESEDDITELTITIYELFDEYIQQNVFRLMSCKFYNEMIISTTEIIFADLYDDDDDIDNLQFNELTEYIKQVADYFLDFYDIPRRTTTTPQIITSIRKLELECIITNLEQIEQPAQRTPDWYKFRYNLITASSLHKALGTPASVNSIICEKCKPLMYTSIFSNVNTGTSLHWGVKYEPVSALIYEHKYNTRIGEFGCIQHPKHSFIGASPDGINIDPNCHLYGRMLEIKNIVNRDITGIPKDEYWVQTQIQMETCNLDECDFVETRFKEYENEYLFYNDDMREYKGIMLQFYEIMNCDNTQSMSPIYKYMPLNIVIESQCINNWINDQTCDMNSHNYKLIDTIYWYLDEFSCVLIPRNKQWFNSTISIIENVWNTILDERINGHEHRINKHTSYNNFNQSKQICIIRLDENGNSIIQ